MENNTTEVIKKETKKRTTKPKVKKEVGNKVTPKKTGRLSDRFKKISNAINIDQKREVPVVSLVSYPVGYQCKLTPQFLSWNEYGDQHTMTIEEVNMMNSEYEGFIKEPMLMVDDEEFAEAYGLIDLYERIFELEDLDEFYKQRPNVIQKKIDALNKDSRKSLFLRTITLIKQGKLNNMSILRLLRDEYGLSIEI